MRYTVCDFTVTDELCEYDYRCATEKQAIDLCSKLNDWHKWQSTFD